jgi:uncharacterized protein
MMSLSEEKFVEALRFCGDAVRARMADNDGSHDYMHVTRVCNNAALILDWAGATNDEEFGQGKTNAVVVAFAATLHDMEDHKYTSGKETDYLLTRAVLDECGVFTKEQTDEIIDVVSKVSWSKEQKTGLKREDKSRELMVVQDADRLDALGATGIARAFLYGGKIGSSIADVTAHFNHKLTGLEFHTHLGKKMAADSKRYMETFIRTISEEALTTVSDSD